jgi:hypothetical protein
MAGDEPMAGEGPAPGGDGAVGTAATPGEEAVLCPVCQQPFAGKRRWCSAACKTAAWRRRRAAGPAVVPSPQPRRPAPGDLARLVREHQALAEASPCTERTAVLSAGQAERRGN